MAYPGKLAQTPEEIKVRLLRCDNVIQVVQRVGKRWEPIIITQDEELAYLVLWCNYRRINGSNFYNDF